VSKNIVFVVDLQEHSCTF